MSIFQRFARSNRTTVFVEMELEVDFDHQEAERATRHYPGCPAAVEVNTLLLDDEELSVKSVNIIMEKYGELIESKCWDQLEDDETEIKIRKAEYRRDI